MGVRRDLSIPRTSTKKLQTKDFEFTEGIDTYNSNDNVALNAWRYATDARQIEVGKWKTRKGNNFYSVPLGEAVNVQQNSTAGASTRSLTTTTWVAQRLTAAATGRCTLVEVNIKTGTGAAGEVIVELREDDGGSPGTVIGTSSIPSSSITGSEQYLKARFIQAPDITNTENYWVVCYIQNGGSGDYIITTTTNTSTAKTSTDSGTTWGSSVASLNVKLYTSTATGVKGVYRVKRPNGSSVTFMAHGTNLYTVNDTTGATTSVDSGLDADATHIRFAFVNDTLYYVTGEQKPRKYDFATAAEVTDAPAEAFAIIEHKGLVFYAQTSDPTKYFYTNFADYDEFTSTDFIYAPAPKTGDPIVGFAKLNGLMYQFTRRNKLVLYGSDNATFSQDEAPGQKGTFTQESLVYDENYVFFASDDGIYQFNGSEEVNIAKDILPSWTSLLSKDTCTLELFNNRLYVWYTPNGQAINSECFVYNVLLRKWESVDTNAFIGRAHSRFDYADLFIQASNRVGALYYGELDSNNYSQLGTPLQFELRTAHNHFDTHGQLKRIPMWRPHFEKGQSSYNVQCGYAFDLDDSANFYDISLAGTGITFDSGYLYDDGHTFASNSEISPTSLTIPGEHRRIQIRYKRHAVNQPVGFDGHTLSLEIQRLV